MAMRKWGAEFLVNSTLVGTQDDPAVIGLPDGGFIVFWQDNSAGSFDIRGQRYSVSGAPVGGEILVLAGDPGQESEVAAAPMASGGWFVGWTDQFMSSATDFDVTGRIFRQDGVLQTNVSVANTTASESQAVFARFKSGIIAVWHNAALNDGDIQVAEISSVGVRGPIVTLNATTAGLQSLPDVSPMADGGYVVAYSSSTGASVIVRRVDPDGYADSEIAVTGSLGSYPQVVGLSSGGFAVAYNIFGGIVVYRVYNAFGAALIPQTTEFGRGDLPFSYDLAPLPNGGFVIFLYDVDRSQIIGQAFDDIGGKQGGEFIVNTTPATADRLSASALGDGRIMVTWVTLGEIYAQIVDPRDGYVIGDAAANILYGHESVADEISGFAGNDVLHGLGGDDSLYGGQDSDTAFGGRGDDNAWGGSGSDTLNGGVGDDALYGEDFADVLIGETGADLIYGGDGNDTANGNAGADVLFGQFGDDLLIGEGDEDALFGGGGVDQLLGGAGNDVLYGEAQGDVLIGDLGDDVLDGGTGGDILNGGPGVDNLNGGTEGDILIGGEGGDRLEGGAGGDLYWWQTIADINDLVVGFSSVEDQLQFTGGAFGGFTPGSTLTNGVTFVAGPTPAPTQAVPTFLYFTGNGGLLFDPDGTGPAGAVFVALLQGAPTLTAGDFQFA